MKTQSTIAEASTEHAHEALERIFHEPSRLAIMSALCAAERGLPFVELRDACRLTDGNLSRHLTALDEAGAIRISKAFVSDKPRTTIRISANGLRRFQEYLAALTVILKQAQQALPQEARQRAVVLGAAVPARG